MIVKWFKTGKYSRVCEFKIVFLFRLQESFWRMFIFLNNNRSSALKRKDVDFLKLGEKRVFGFDECGS